MQARLLVFRAAAMLRGTPAVPEGSAPCPNRPVRPTPFSPYSTTCAPKGVNSTSLIGELSPAQWATPTAAPGWTIAHQIAHLAWTDTAALLAVTDPDAFAAEVEKAVGVAGHLRGRRAPRRGPCCRPPSCSPGGATAAYSSKRRLRAAPAGARFPWYGPPMSTASMATGRLMETWAHGQDVFDALGRTRRPTDRLRHVARIGVRARDYAFAVRGLDAAGRGVPGRADRAGRRRAVDVRARATPNSASPGPRWTSASWSPSACTAATPPYGPRAPTPTAGSTSPRPSPGPAGPGRPPRRPRAAAWTGPGEPTAHRQRLRLLRRPLRRDAGDADRRPPRRPHRRLPRRTHPADPRPRPAARPGGSGTPRRSCANWRSASGSRMSAGCGSSTNAGGLNPAGLAGAVRELSDRVGVPVRVAHVEGDALAAARGRAHRQRLPRRRRHRGLPARRARTSSSPGG